MNKFAAYRLLDRIITHTPQQTIDFGSRFAQRLGPADVIALSGNLGSGKTTCIRGICTGLQVTELITSPSFTLINEYHGRVPVFHFDFYRIQEPNELHDLGIADYFYGDGICLVEWPQVVETLLPAHHFRIQLYHANEKAFGRFSRQAGATDLQHTEAGENDRYKDGNRPRGAGQDDTATKFSPQDQRLIEAYQHDHTRD
ncbi:tRNA (adenosine(37)-N6)-threonylcarbamoyltransferase complex ATPase subunit type 1 TsaE [candidate division KSB1 bacterium]|nr:tRNA (adenosine(37)-N6)-threonylcarbamoyltransferase complex ATPase subunit type 1 TsaE [candidate division KSB1 bacterium]